MAKIAEKISLATRIAAALLISTPSSGNRLTRGGAFSLVDPAMPESTGRRCTLFRAARTIDGFWLKAPLQPGPAADSASGPLRGCASMRRCEPVHVYVPTPVYLVHAHERMCRCPPGKTARLCAAIAASPHFLKRRASGNFRNRKAEGYLR
jgi:hypothetical protein